jgi:hypothetical protein
MGTAKVQHSKYKNTGILFELLARQVTADTLNGKEKSPAINIIRDYFAPTTELGKELVLYRSVFDATQLSEAKALKFLDMILAQRKKLNEKKLSEQKYHLIKELKDAYPLKEFLSSKIPQYKVYASIYKTFRSEARPQEVDVCDIQDAATSRFTIVEHMTSGVTTTDKKTAQLIETYKEQQEDLRLLTYRILVDRFNEKYSSLDQKQKILLREYINNVSNTNSLREYVNTEVPFVKKELQKRIPLIDSKVTRIKLKEVVSQLDNLTKGRLVRDNQIAALMVAYQLIREIDDVRSLKR